MTDDREIEYRRRRAAGEWLRAERKRRGYSPADFAGKIGVGFQQLNKYEIGEGRISDERAELISQALRLPLLEVRHRLGLWVPGPDPLEGDERELEEIISTHPRLTDHQRQVLLGLIAEFRLSQEGREAL